MDNIRSRFLALPVELRYEIYDMVLRSKAERPGTAREPRFRHGKSRLTTMLGKMLVLYQADVLIFASSALLRCNKQINAEVLDVLRHGNFEYQLDLVSGLSTMVITWLALPAPPAFVKRARFDLRIPDVQGSFEMWLDIDSPTALAAITVDLLHFFYLFGPHFSPPRHDDPWDFAPNSLGVHYIPWHDNKGLACTKYNELIVGDMVADGFSAGAIKINGCAGTQAFLVFYLERLLGIEQNERGIDAQEGQSVFFECLDHKTSRVMKETRCIRRISHPSVVWMKHCDDGIVRPFLAKYRTEY